jgi:2-desacetyl-2-hydroxyethyl bacteriochlorophyllide A dehydrogenase
MNSIGLDAPGVWKLSQTTRQDVSKLGDEEVLVGVKKIGICGTDYHAFRGKQPFFNYPRILGHELGVEVKAIGKKVSGVKIGDRASIEPYMECGTCVACRRGKPNCCVNMKVLGVHIDGGMREELIVPAKKIHVSKSLSFEELALVETLGIGAHAVSRANLEKGETVLVIGAGPIGLSVIQFALIAEARVIVLDLSESRLDFVKKQFGVKETIGAGVDVVSVLNELTHTELATAVFDATGHPGSMEGAFDYVAHGGRLVFVGLHQNEVKFKDPLFHRKEMTLMASRNALSKDFKFIIDGMEKGSINTKPWITHRADFLELPNIFETWLKPETGVIKAMLSL